MSDGCQENKDGLLKQLYVIMKAMVNPNAPGPVIKFNLEKIIMLYAHKRKNKDRLRSCQFSDVFKGPITIDQFELIDCDWFFSKKIVTGI